MTSPIQKYDGISSSQGVHFVTLQSVNTLVEGIPDKVCPVRTFRFALPNRDTTLSETIQTGLGDRIKIHSMPGNAGGHKSYSPTHLSTPGEIDLTVKIYPDGVNSQAFDSLKIGDTIGMSGPWPPEPARAQRSPAKQVNLVAFGVGLTEIIEVARSELQQENAKKVTLLYANRYQEDAFFKCELAELQKEHPKRFSVHYLYSREENRRRVNADVLRETFHLPESPDQPGHSDQRFVVVGTKAMINDTWDKYLGEFGYNRKDHSLLVFDKQKMAAAKRERIQIVFQDLKAKNDMFAHRDRHVIGKKSTAVK
mmetsp:Transcript_20114/g.50052  ORF Transcript_20114/g.50052 Transcript_20114/m.50052 type:complete len:310 (-) Transcript_20114:169-1098(-)